MPVGPIYDAVVRGDGDVLLLDILDVGFSQARSEGEIGAMAGDYISGMTDQPVGTFGLNVIRA